MFTISEFDINMGRPLFNVLKCEICNFGPDLQLLHIMNATDFLPVLINIKHTKIFCHFCRIYFYNYFFIICACGANDAKMVLFEKLQYTKQQVLRLEG